MNRIKIDPLAVSAPPEQDQHTAAVAFDQIEKLAVSSGGECTVFAPLHYEPNYKYPLIVWLHGGGDDKSQLQRVMPEISLRNFVGIAPDGNCGNEITGFEWHQSHAGISAADVSVVNAIDEALFRFNINQRRIFIAGIGSGGEMAFRIAFERPELFAGVISLNGSLPVQDAPLSSWQLCRDVPVFLAHSRNFPQYDEQLLCQQLRLLHIAGFSVTLRQYPGCDSVASGMLPDLNNWIMETIESAVGIRRNS